MIRRICFYGGPGCGKSTIAARVFADLKMKHYNVEQVTEYIKTWAHEGKFPKSFDQLYVFGKQMHREDVVLQHVDLIVTDSPLLMNSVYAETYGFPGWPELVSLGKKFEEKYPSINFFLPRRFDYKNEEGRYQDLEQAKEIDNAILTRMKHQLPQGGCYYNVWESGDVVRVIVESLTNGLSIQKVSVAEDA